MALALGTDEVLIRGYACAVTTDGNLQRGGRRAYCGNLSRRSCGHQCLSYSQRRLRSEDFGKSHSLSLLLSFSRSL